MKRPTTISSLALEFSCDNRSVRKWLMQAGVNAADSKKARHVVKTRKAGHEAHMEGEDSPSKRKTIAEAEKIERENRIAEKLESREYLLKSEIEQVITIGIGKLELIPVKMASEFALPDTQVKKLTELLDEVRHEWSKDILALT
jgi:hypothetical protein